MVGRINISLPEGVLQGLDGAARESRLGRSSLVVQALRHFLEEKEEERKREKRRQAAAAIDRLREEFGGWHGTAEVRKW